MIGLANINWGDVPTWISATATCAGLLLLTLAAIIGRRTYRLQAEERRQADALIRKTQAALVSVWWGPPPTASTSNDRAGPHSGAEAAAPAAKSGWLLNASTGPIYRALVHAEFKHSRHEAVVHIPVVLPGPRTSVLEEPQTSRGKSRNSDSDYSLSVRFTDASGIRWIRDEYGGLSELDPIFEIWASPEHASVLKPFIAEFSHTYGVKANIESRYIERKLRERFLNTDPGPDVLVAPHDWLGRLRAENAVTPITLWDECLNRLNHPPLALNALKAGGKIYGIPSSLDTAALIRNTALAPELPTSFDDLIKAGETLKQEGKVQQAIAIPVGRQGNPFHLWPLLGSAVAPLFHVSPSGGWDPDASQITSADTIGVWRTIRELGRQRILRTDIGARESEDLFTSGKVAFAIATSGPAIRAQRAGLSVEVSEVPRLRGIPYKSLVAVYAFYIAARGRNRMMAQDLIPDYLSRPDVIERFGGVDAGDIGDVVPLQVSSYHDPVLHTFHRLCSDGEPMQTFSQIDAVWECIAQTELALLKGRDSLDIIANELARSIRVLAAGHGGQQSTSRLG